MTHKRRQNRAQGMPRMKPEPHFGPTYDPKWVYQQLVLALKVKQTRYQLRGRKLIDTQTGQVVRRKTTAADLIAVITGEGLAG